MPKIAVKIKSTIIWNHLSSKRYASLSSTQSSLLWKIHPLISHLLREISSVTLILKCHLKASNKAPCLPSNLSIWTFKTFNKYQLTKRINSFLKNLLLKDKTYLLYLTKKGSHKSKNLKEWRMLIRKERCSNIKELHRISVQVKNKIVRSQSILEKKTKKTSTLMLGLY